MKRLAFVFAFLAIALTACPQRPDGTFNTIVVANKGIQFGDGTIQLTAPVGGEVGDVYWNGILEKPLLFPPTVHTHDALYKPIGWKADWNTDILNKPQEIPLTQAIEQLGYLPIPERTTAEINSLVLPVGKSGIVKDKTLNVYRLWDGVSWSKIVITSN